MATRFFYFGRTATRAFLDIHKKSAELWGPKKADAYLQKIYQKIDKICDNPNIGMSRQKRSSPFLMVPAEKHFVIYHLHKNNILILAILHQSRNIEQIISKNEDMFRIEIEEIKSRIK
mgnify:CR=1 FL=1